MAKNGAKHEYCKLLNSVYPWLSRKDAEYVVTKIGLDATLERIEGGISDVESLIASLADHADGFDSGQIFGIVTELRKIQARAEIGVSWDWIGRTVYERVFPILAKLDKEPEPEAKT